MVVFSCVGGVAADVNAGIADGGNECNRIWEVGAQKSDALIATIALPHVSVGRHSWRRESVGCIWLHHWLIHNGVITIHDVRWGRVPSTSITLAISIMRIIGGYYGQSVGHWPQIDSHSTFLLAAWYRLIHPIMIEEIDSPTQHDRKSFSQFWFRSLSLILNCV